MTYVRQIEKVLLLLTAPGPVAIAVSFFLNRSNKAWFTVLWFYWPCLWVFWLVSVCASERTRFRWLRLLALWLLIDVGILLSLLSIALDVPAITASQGTDVVIFIVYAPVVIPIGFLVSALPDAQWSLVTQVAHASGAWMTAGARDAFATWIQFSLIAAVQSLLVAGLISLVRARLSTAPIES